MTRPRKSPQDYPLPLRIPYYLLAGCASLRLAVVLIALLSVVLGWATFVEQDFGTQAVQFGVYGAWWFFWLGILLAANVLCSALIRFPWKTRHVGFLVTHAGILILLFGCAITYWAGFNADLPLLEEAGARSLAYHRTQHFELLVDGDDVDGAEPITVTFAPGPFNWRDYAELPWFPWGLSTRNRAGDVLYDQDGIRLKVLDYYSDSEYVKAPKLKLQVSATETTPRGSGRPAQKTVTAAEVQLGVFPNLNPDPKQPQRNRYGFGESVRTVGGNTVTFWMTGSAAETEAFRRSRPSGSLGRMGQAVLYADGKSYTLPVDEFHASQAESDPRDSNPPRRFPLGNSGLEVDVKELDFLDLCLKLRVYRNGEAYNEKKPPEELWLYANRPHESQQDYRNEVFGTFWFDPAPTGGMALSSLAFQQAGSPRVDVLQGEDNLLYYRACQAGEVGQIDRLSSDGSQVKTFGQSDAPLTLSVAKFSPQHAPGKPIPQPFVKPSEKKIPKQPLAHVLLEVDGREQEFWLAARGTYPFAKPLRGDQIKVVRGKGRSAAIGLRRDEVDLGFSVYLRDFLKEMYPGTGMVRNYSSQVDVIERTGDELPKSLWEKAMVTMNAPIDFTDSATGRPYRLSQQSYTGPWVARQEHPWSEEPNYYIGRLVAEDIERTNVYVSILGVNYDPGRGIKYAGSVLIILGMVIVLLRRMSTFSKRPSNGVPIVEDG